MTSANRSMRNRVKKREKYLYASIKISHARTNTARIYLIVALSVYPYFLSHPIFMTHENKKHRGIYLQLH